MNYAVEMNEMDRPRIAFMPAHDWWVVIAFTLLGTFINLIPYSNSRSIILQTLLLGGIFLLYRSRPAMMIAAYIFLNILPTRMSGGFSESAQIFYTLNSRICIVFALIFFAYGLIILKRTYNIELTIVAFVLFIFFSWIWTLDPTWYDNDLWWMCTAYLIFPLFIQDDADVRLILTSYVFAVGIFCINVLPMLLKNPDLYRGSINLDPNYAAFFILVGITVILVSFTLFGRYLTFLYKIFLMAVGILGIITMSYFASRTSFVILAVLLALYLLYNFKKARTVIQGLLGFSLLFFVMEQYGYFEAVLQRFKDVTTVSAGGRFEIQQTLLQSMFNSDLFNIFFGHGYLTAGSFGLGLQAHNTYVSIVHSFGLLGLLIYIFYLIKMYIPLRNSLYSPFLIMFWFLCIYGLSLEPYHMVEGVLMFCLLSGVAFMDTTSLTDEYAQIEEEVR